MRPKPCTAIEVERVVLRLGFVRVPHGDGSHRKYIMGPLHTSIAFHRGDIPSGTLRRIVRDIGLTVERFNEIV